MRSLKRQKQRLETKLEYEKIVLTKMPVLSQKILDIIKLRGRGTISELVSLTGGNRNTLKKHLENLVAGNHICKQGVGKGSWYTLQNDK